MQVARRAEETEVRRKGPNIRYRVRELHLLATVAARHMD
jgi:hypothetical protein